MARILVAADDPGTADVLADALRQHGYAVRVGYSAEQCLKLIAEFRPQVALLAIDGQLARLLGGHHLPVVQLEKPLDMLALLRSIRQAI